MIVTVSSRATVAPKNSAPTVYLSSPQFPIKTPGEYFCSILHPGMCHFLGSPWAMFYWKLVILTQAHVDWLKALLAIVSKCKLPGFDCFKIQQCFIGNFIA